MNFLKKYSSNELFRASFILLILINVANLIGYLFHFIMGRMLGPLGYGVMATLTSIIYIFMVPTTAIQTLVSRNTTKFNVKKNYGKIKGMMKYLLIEAGIWALVLFGIFVVISFLLSDVLGIQLSLLILTGLFIFGAFMLPVVLGIVQGMKKFSAWGWNTVLNSTVKIIIGITLVILGFGVYGGILGFVLGMFVSFIFVFPYIKEVIKAKEIKEKTPIFSRENISLLGSILIITLMYSLDIIFAKALFSPTVAGNYSIVSMIGKIIFFGASSISGAMFPISSERFIKNRKSDNLLQRTVVIISVLCLIALIALLIFPKIIIGILFGDNYLSGSNILFYIGVAFSALALTNNYILYKISRYDFRIRHVLILCLFLIIQIINFILFRKDITSFSIGFMVSSIVTLFGSLILIKTRSK